MRLKDKTALVTGAASGIGKTIAILFAREGARVAVVDRDAEGGVATAGAIRAQGGQAIFAQADLTQAQAVQRVVQETAQTFGAINVLVNNAGVFRFGSVVDCSEEDWERVMAVNLKSVFLVCKRIIPEMMQGGEGSIVNIASVKGLQGMENASAYAASKGGVIQLTRSMALDYGSRNIRVNCVCPGAIQTPMLDGIFREEAQGSSVEATRQAHAQERPLRMLGTPENVAYAALYLASDEARYITGVCLVVDGGLLA